MRDARNNPHELQAINSIVYIAKLFREIGFDVPPETASQLYARAHLGSDYVQEFEQNNWSPEKLCDELYSQLPSELKVVPVRGASMKTFANAVNTDLQNLLGSLNASQSLSDIEKRAVRRFLSDVQNLVSALLTDS